MVFFKKALYKKQQQGDYTGGAPPVPIPTTEVKSTEADVTDYSSGK